MGPFLKETFGIARGRTAMGCRYGHRRLAHVQHGGNYVVTLRPERWGTTATASQHITLNSPPAAAFTSTCLALTCTFNASGSSDLHGTIVNYAWNFGDATTGSGATLTHTYAVGGSSR